MAERVADVGGPRVSSQFGKVGLLVLVQTKCAGERGQDHSGSRDTPLFEPGVVVDTDRREQSNLFAAQTRNPPRDVDPRQTYIAWAEAGSTSFPAVSKLAEFFAANLPAVLVPVGAA